MFRQLRRESYREEHDDEKSDPGRAEPPRGVPAGAGEAPFDAGDDRLRGAGAAREGALRQARMGAGVADLAMYGLTLSVLRKRAMNAEPTEPLSFAWPTP